MLQRSESPGPRWPLSPAAAQRRQYPQVLVLAAGPLQGRVAEVREVGGPPWRYTVGNGGVVQADLAEDLLTSPPPAGSRVRR